MATGLFLALTGAAAGAFLTGTVVLDSAAVEKPSTTTLTARVSNEEQVETLVLDVVTHPQWQLSLPPMEGAVLTSIDVDRGRRVRACTRLGSINDQPVFTLPGQIPLYRDLRRGDRGVDVTRLQQALAWCGQPSTDTAGTFGSSTQASVKALTGTGTVSADRVAWIPSDIDEVVVASWGGAIGGPLSAQTPPLELSSTEVVAVAVLNDPEEDRITVGDKVTVSDAQGRRGTTHVASIGRAPLAQASPGAATDAPATESDTPPTARQVTLRPTNITKPASATWELARSPKPSLSVPLAAINQCGGTGSCVTVVEGTSRREVPIRVLVVGETGVAVEPVSQQSSLRVGDAVLLDAP